jgi:hypothetical protein
LLDCALADAEVLLSHAVGIVRHSLRLKLPSLLLQPHRVEVFGRSVAARCSGMPVPYITRTRDFHNHRFFVTPDVLIPRPETEILIERALELAPSLPQCSGSASTLVDLGCGSGISPNLPLSEMSCTHRCRSYVSSLQAALRCHCCILFLSTGAVLPTIFPLLLFELPASMNFAFERAVIRVKSPRCC